MRRTLVRSAVVGSVVGCAVVAALASVGSAAESPAPAAPSVVAHRQATTSATPAGGVGVTVGAVSFTENDGLAAELHAGHHYRTGLMLVVSPGYEGAIATVTVQDGAVDGCVAIPLRTGVAEPLRCQIRVGPHPTGHPPAAAVVVTVTVRLPNGSNLVKTYLHSLKRTSRSQG